MNKGELVDAIAAAMDMPKAQAEKAVNTTLKTIEQGLQKDGKVSLVGFGTFEVRTRKARMGRNPRTGEQIEIKAGTSVGFKAGKALKDSV